jgi:hypothetical protein
VRAPDESIEDIQSVVFVRTAEMEEGRDVCRSAEGRVAVAAGKEVVLEISVDFGLVDDGIYDVVFNLAVLVAPGRDTCAQARYERGQARLRVEVQGDHVRM